MIRQRRFPLTALFIALVGSAALVGCSSPENSQEEAQSAEDRLTPVRVATAEDMELSQVEVYSATIQAWEQAQILGQTGLRIEEIYVDEGDRVRKGQAIARMDDSNLRQAQVELRSAETDLARAQRLVEIGAVASQQLEQAQDRLETVQTNVEMLRENTHLVSPIAGVVTDKYFVAGEQFVAGAQAPGIVTIQQLHPLKVIIDVSERFYADLETGMSAKITVDAYRDQEFDGQISRKRTTIDPSSRTFAVEIRVDNSDGRLSPGMSGEVRLPMGEVQGRFLPRAALLFEPGKKDPYVYVIEDGEARRVFVKVGRRVENYQEVLSGLADDAQIVIEGMGRLNEGAKVQIMDETKDPEPAQEQAPPQEGRAQDMDEVEGEPS